MFGDQNNLVKHPNMINLYNLEHINAMFSGCSKLTEVLLFGTIKVKSMHYAFYNCRELITVKSLDMISVDSTNSMFNYCYKLTNLTLKNIKISLQIGSGTSWGHLLTLDSLLNTIQELWINDTTSTKTLTMGTANTAKLADVYVKLVDITDEMRAEDQYIDNKAPFVQCESTEEGAMSISEYVTTIKKWQLA